MLYLAIGIFSSRVTVYELGFGFNLGVFLKLGFVSLFRGFPEIWIFPKNSRLSESVMVLSHGADC